MLLYFCPTASDSFSDIPGQSFQLLRTCCPEALDNMSASSGIMLGYVFCTKYKSFITLLS